MEDELNFQVGISGDGLSVTETQQAVQNMQEAEQERAVLREQNAQIEEAKIEANKPKDAWYLEYLGVDPKSHSLGLGSLILKNSLSKIDALHQPAYLESSNPRNMSLYERHGFETVNKFQFGDGPPIHTMFRAAR